MRKRPLFLFACVFLIGLAYQRYQHLGLLVVFVLVLLYEMYFGIKHKNIKKAAGRSAILLSAFLLGMIHMYKEEDFRDAYMSKIEDGEQITIWGEIRKIENTDYGIRMILSDSYISLNEEKIPCNDIMVYTSSNHFHVGEIHKITGQLNMFEKARNQGNFDSFVFYQSQKIDFSVNEESHVLMGKNSNSFKELLLGLKERIKKVYDNSLQANAAGFFTGMILGDKTNLDDTLKDLFARGGISHILAISGLHVSIIGRGFYSQLRKRKVGFDIAGVLAGMLLLAYCYMVGSGMSAVRAVGMMLIYFLGQYIGRSYDMLNALGAICVVLLWENPFLLEYSGFWFSVTALIGVGFVGNVFSHLVDEKQGDHGGVKGFLNDMEGNFCMSFGITLSTLPVVACCYYEIPLYSSLVNFVVLPLLTPIFCLALLGGLIGVWIPWLAKILLIPCSWGLLFYEWVCSTIEKLPWASIICGEPKIEVMVLYYVILFSGVSMLAYIRKDRQNRMARSDKKTILRKERFWILSLSILCLLLVIYPKQKLCEITFLDVGQGDGIYISAGDGITMFIDGGSSNVKGVGEYRILPFLKAKGVSSIDYWFVSHADSDHISGLMEVLESGYEISCLVLAEACPKDENYKSLVEKAAENEIEVLSMQVGDIIKTQNTKMTCVYPFINQVEDRNDASLVLEFECYGDYKALFTGDISTEVEEQLVKEGSLREVDLYKAAHHGSNHSNSKLLLEAVCPETVVVSCSATNNYGHPGEEAVERLKSVGADVYYTMESGQVTIFLTQNGEKGCFKVKKMLDTVFLV